ncbi:hypothetical protein CWO90_32500 [Bradyrhizobium sp. Leo121]|nr:hypothetical protein CWO90_32500 [Bradyrhizobium sp. Leo121]
MLKRFFLTLALALGIASPAMSAGTISFSLSQQFDSLGKPLSECKLYFYQAGTVATPQNAYQDTNLTIPQPNPMTCDSAGRLGQFFLADGQIKVRLTNAAGVDQVVADNILVIGPSSGGGGGGSVDPTTVLSTGDMKVVYGTGTLAGFVRANGRTIGSATSGATERANADTQALFVYLCANDPNLVMTPARSGNCANDFAANKVIATPDLRGRVIAGLDDMGNTAAGRLSSPGFGAAATTLGQVNSGNNGQTVTLTPSLIPTITSVVSVTGSISGTTSSVFQAGGAPLASGPGTGVVNAPASVSGTFAGGGSATSNNTGGSSTTIPNVQPTMVMSIFIKL